MKRKKQEEKQYLEMPIEIKSIDADNYTLEAVFSTANQDRHGDIVMQNWILTNFKKNPVILNSHNYYDCAEVVANADKITVKNGQLEGKLRFAVNENPKAKIIFDLYAAGFLHAFSVGFIVKQWDDKGNMLKSELLEISCVSVPANADALVKAKAKGIDVDQLYVKSNDKDNLPNKSDNQPDAEPGSDDSKPNGGEGQPGSEPNRGNKDDDKDNQPELVEPQKTVNEIINESINTINNKKISALRKINEAIRLVGQSLGDKKSETPAENNRLINQAIRKLIKLKD